jgi:hypothetical protein
VSFVHKEASQPTEASQQEQASKHLAGRTSPLLLTPSLLLSYMSTVGGSFLGHLKFKFSQRGL